MQIVHRRHLHSIATLLSSNILSSALIAGGTVVVSRIVSPTTFGHYSYAAQLALTIYPALTFRFEQALPLLGRRNYSKFTFLAFIICLSIVVTSILFILNFVFHSYFSTIISIDRAIVDLIPLVLIMAFSASVSGALQSYTLSQGALTRLAVARVTRSLVVVLLQIALVLALGAAAIWLLVAELVANVIQAAVLGGAIEGVGLGDSVRRRRRYVVLRIVALVKSHSVFPFVTLPHMLIHAGLGLLLATVIGGYYGSDALGQYYLMRKLAFGALSIFGLAIYQHSIAEAAQVSREMVFGVALRALVMISGITVVSAVAVALFGPRMFVLVAGEEWELAGKMAVASIPLILVEPVTSAFAFVPVFLGLQPLAFAVAVAQGCAGVAAVVVASWLGWSSTTAILFSSIVVSVIMLSYVAYLLWKAKNISIVKKYV